MDTVLNTRGVTAPLSPAKAAPAGLGLAKLQRWRPAPLPSAHPSS